MGQSQVGLAVTAGQPKKGAPVLLLALGAMAVLGIGGGVVFYKMSGSEPAPAGKPEATATATATATTEPSATATATVTATATATETVTATATETASATESAADPKTAKPNVGRPTPPRTAKPEVTSKPVPTGPGGRPINSGL